MTPLPARLRYLSGYPPELLARVDELIEHGRLGESLSKRYLEFDVRLWLTSLELDGRAVRRGPR